MERGARGKSYAAFGTAITFSSLEEEGERKDIARKEEEEEEDKDNYFTTFHFIIEELKAFPVILDIYKLLAYILRSRPCLFIAVFLSPFSRSLCSSSCCSLLFRDKASPPPSWICSPLKVGLRGKEKKKGGDL